MMVNFLFWILILAGIVYFFAWMTRRATAEPPFKLESTRRGDMPLEILKRRYASGEISSEEFARMKKDLL
ncbi:SHOCT domain-containing protein [candidate division KSB1 bacterium]|nr:SHOCT domain-containing protein [candidate division KSB1 bacterium]